ncbi:MAG: hypothetical protein JNL61_16330 [Rhizobiaceae bacterium]|nr:hypothetical protein [Rhizobiaceae bacterium]
MLVMSVGGVAPAAAAQDYRFEPSIARPAEAVTMAARLPANIAQGPAVVFSRQMAAIPQDYAPAMVWYRTALVRGAPQFATGEPRGDEEEADPLEFVWRAENGDLVSKTGRGLFHLTYGAAGNSWYRELDCRLVAWPDGESKATMNCSDGAQRTMVIPSAGTVVIDDISYIRPVAEEPWADDSDMGVPSDSPGPEEAGPADAAETAQ